MFNHETHSCQEVNSKFSLEQNSGCSSRKLSTTVDFTTVVDERLSTTTTRVLFQRESTYLLQETTEWEIYTKFMPRNIIFLFAAEQHFAHLQNSFLLPTGLPIVRTFRKIKKKMTKYIYLQFFFQCIFYSFNLKVSQCLKCLICMVTPLKFYCRTVPSADKNSF